MMQIVKFPNFIMESVQVDKRRNILSYQDAKMDYSLSFLEESFDYVKTQLQTSWTWNYPIYKYYIDKKNFTTFQELLEQCILPCVSKHGFEYFKKYYLIYKREYEEVNVWNDVDYHKVYEFQWNTDDFITFYFVRFVEC